MNTVTRLALSRKFLITECAWIAASAFIEQTITDILDHGL